MPPRALKLAASFMTVCCAPSISQADCIAAEQFDVPGNNLAIFGVQLSVDYLGPPVGTITETSVELSYETGGSLDASDLILQFQAPSTGVPVWQLTGAELGWSGSGTFQASLATDQLNGVIDLGEPVPDFSLFLLVITAEGFQPLAGSFTASFFEVDVAPVGFVPGDVDGDGVVNVSDLVEVILGWGPCPSPPRGCPADVTCDGEVDVLDLLEVILGWS